VLLVGAPYQRGGGGVWRVPSLEAGAWAVSEVGALITSATAADLTGFALTGRADFDGDGLEDVLIGVPGYDVAGDNNAGALFRVSAIVE
jgi:hypothetical protein